MIDCAKKTARWAHDARLCRPGVPLKCTSHRAFELRRRTLSYTGTFEIKSFLILCARAFEREKVSGFLASSTLISSSAPAANPFGLLLLVGFTCVGQDAADALDIFGRPTSCDDGDGRERRSSAAGRKNECANYKEIVRRATHTPHLCQMEIGL